MKPTLSQRPDRRRVRTRSQLAHALFSLIMERGYDDLTVQEIADRADVSRATFYLHFNDKDDLLLTTLAERYDEIVAQLPPLTLDNMLPNGTPPCTVAFQQAAEYRDLYRVVLSSATAPILHLGIKSYLTDRLREEYEVFAREHAMTSMAIPMDILMEHLASSLMGLIVWWLGQDDPSLTVERMSYLYHQMNVRSWMIAFGIQEPEQQP